MLKEIVNRPPISVIDALIEARERKNGIAPWKSDLDLQERLMQEQWEALNDYNKRNRRARSF